MRWLSLISKIPYLVKTLPFNKDEAIKFTAKIKDVLLKPSESSIQFITAILNKQNYILKRITSVVLLIAALILGADIGIDYQRKQIDPTLFEPKILTAPLERPEDKVEIVTNPLPEIKSSEEIEQEPEVLIPLIDPIPQEYRAYINKKKILIKKIKPKNKTEIFVPFSLNSSGVNGY